MIFDYLFGLTKGLSDALRSPDLDLAAAVCLISSVENTLSESRSDTSWSKLWDEAMKLTKLPYQGSDLVGSVVCQDD